MTVCTECGGVGGTHKNSCRVPLESSRSRQSKNEALYSLETDIHPSAVIETLTYARDMVEKQAFSTQHNWRLGSLISSAANATPIPAVPVTPLPIDPRWTNAMRSIGIEDPRADHPVHHPNHYTAYKGLEVIDLTEQMNFNRGNAVKYIARAGLKSKDTEIQDLQKAAWYINREIERLENE